MSAPLRWLACSFLKHKLATATLKQAHIPIINQPLPPPSLLNALGVSGATTTTNPERITTEGEGKQRTKNPLNRQPNPHQIRPLPHSIPQKLIRRILVPDHAMYPDFLQILDTVERVERGGRPAAGKAALHAGGGGVCEVCCCLVRVL